MDFQGMGNWARSRLNDRDMDTKGGSAIPLTAIFRAAIELCGEAAFNLTTAEQVLLQSKHSRVSRRLVREYFEVIVNLSVNEAVIEACSLVLRKKLEEESRDVVHIKHDYTINDIYRGHVLVFAVDFPGDRKWR